MASERLAWAMQEQLLEDAKQKKAATENAEFTENYRHLKNIPVIPAHDCREKVSSHSE